MSDAAGRMPDRHLRGLDSIRFIAAFWVVWSHFPPVTLIARDDRSSGWKFILSAGEGALFNGAAAVMVFFVISGFCIHYPHARGAPFQPAAFFLRRYLRIGLPLAAAAVPAAIAGLPFSMLHEMVIWSLFSELIYYALYPAVLACRRRFPWALILAISFALALAVVLQAPHHASRSPSHPTWGNYPSYGIAGTAILGLPCWLLGVQLADWRVTRTAPRQTGSIWAWRLAIWAASSVLLALRFHSPLGYPWTLDVFAVGAYFWLRQELLHFENARPWRVLEWAGLWSYSLYLVHPLAKPLFPLIGESWLARLALLGFTLAVSYAFHLLAERPSHELARALARRWVRTPVAAPETRAS